MGDLEIEETPVPGLLVLRLPVHADARGWFKENWQHEKMTALGMPALDPVQHNVSFNARRGVTRGIHAEPWDKYVSVVTGRVFGAWVDLREGAGFGTTHHLEIDPGTAVFVPRGVGNSFQVLEDATAYTYLVNGRWSPGDGYTAVHPAEPALAIPWPIPLAEAVLSEKDDQAPALASVVPVPPPRTLVIGARGQLGSALARALPAAHGVDREELDITDREQLDAWPWHRYDRVVNAAAFTRVDDAETPEGRARAWQLNAEAPAALARLADLHRFVLVHYSTDYVFDGRIEVHDECEPLSPLGVYAQSKAAGDLAVAGAARHFLVRTSWLVGEGRNFVRTMADLASRGVTPTVVDDQVGRLTFADELVRATRHLLETRAPYGTYNCTNDGPATSWADVARVVYAACGLPEGQVIPVSTEEYGADKRLAPRPARSVLDLRKLQATGFEPEGAGAALARYVAALVGPTHAATTAPEGGS